MEEINKAFASLISERAIHKKLGITSDLVRKYRQFLKKGKTISTDLKLNLLKTSGWRPEATKYTRQDLVSLLNFYKRTSQAARDHGPEYVIDKWEISKNKK